MPAHIRSVDAPGISRIDLIDATPIGVNVRSTVATYSGVLDDLRRLFAAVPEAREKGYKAGISPTTPGPCGAPAVTAPARSPWTSSFCPTWTLSAPTAGAGGMGKLLPPSAAPGQKGPGG